MELTKYFEYIYIFCLLFLCGIMFWMSWDNIQHNHLISNYCYNLSIKCQSNNILVENLNNNIINMIDSYDRCKLYNISIKDNIKINGVYFKDDYYCVWIKGRNFTPVNIAITEAHEICHTYTDMINTSSYEHFCNKNDTD